MEIIESNGSNHLETSRHSHTSSSPFFFSSFAEKKKKNSLCVYSSSGSGIVNSISKVLWRIPPPKENDMEHTGAGSSSFKPHFVLLLFIVNEEDSSCIPLPKNEMSYLFFLLFYYYFVVRATCGERKGKKKELFATYSKNFVGPLPASRPLHAGYIRRS